MLPPAAARVEFLPHWTTCLLLSATLSSALMRGRGNRQTQNSATPREKTHGQAAHSRRFHVSARLQGI